MISFDIGLSALRAAQLTTDTIGQNLANANTPDYHRQLTDLVTALPIPYGTLQLGTGVDVPRIRQLRDDLVETAITTNTADQGATQSQLDTLNQIQAIFGTGEGSLGNDLEAFFNQVQQLASQPDSSTQRQLLIGSASTLSNKFNTLANSLETVQSGLDAQLQQSINNINADAQQIAKLNGQILAASGAGVSSNDLLDQRSQVINDLAKFVGIQVYPQGSDQVSVAAGAITLVTSTNAKSLQISVDSTSQVAVLTSDTKTPVAVNGGQLSGLLSLRNQAVPAYQATLDALAGQLSQQINNVQTTGIGLSGPGTFLATENAVRNITVPLSKAGLRVSPQAGSLYVTVTNLATGAHTLTALNIDPTTQSLQDVATALNGVANIQAVTNAQTGKLQILAKQGFAFDFSGRPPSTPSTAGITGTTTVQLAGAYTGSANDTFNFAVVGSGTVGVTPGLSLRVTSASGTVIANLNIGQGYSPSTNLDVGKGLSVQLASGTANNGDTFSTPAIAQPDTSGILTSLGLGTFFQGTTARDLAVSDALKNNPDLLATSRTGQPGDASDLSRLSALHDLPLFASNSQTFGQAYNALIGDVGSQINQLASLKTSQTSIGQQLAAQQQSVSGVDPNEELVHLLNSQQAFEVASKYISTVNDTLTSLLNIL